MITMVFLFSAALTFVIAWMIVLTVAWVKARHRHDRLTNRVRAMHNEVVKAKRVRHTTTGSIPKVQPPDNPGPSTGAPFRLMPTDEYAEMAKALADAQAALPAPPVDPAPGTAPIGQVKPPTRGRHAAP